ncbi:DUF6163 family protein [Lentilitoribacter sp. Alg239-R112]|uniref:DUF6163 family protein n=1 Tax=Lentilitoribacter sp. Alg239-R112 TaxID=2305987 RepID=UPI0013A6FB6C|nr:DUF6163 family protein [Lentilitoribacter sp. Alg239-R112]
MPTLDDLDVNLSGLKSDADAVPENLDRLYQVFLVVVTLICILGAVNYWAQLMGISYGGALRFDIAPLHWKIVQVILALLLPLTALGIWFRNSFGLWGWVLVTAIQFIVHGLLKDSYGENEMHLAVSAGIVVLFLIFRFAFYRREKERLEEGKE